MSALFDGYATHYDEALDRGISLSGESKPYFARNRVAWLKRCIDKIGDNRPRSVLDFGCGTGTSVPYFFELLGVEHFIGVDSSVVSLEAARRSADPSKVSFHLLEKYVPEGLIDLSFSSGVFHHIEPNLRPKAIRYVFDSLKPGGIFAFWENNPWNPATKMVMSRIPFDRDAQTLCVIEARRLLRSAGFCVLRTDFIFIFPHLLRMFRPLERRVSRFPIGTQYQILCRKP